MGSRAERYLGSKFGLSGKRVLITGASSGFGEHFARMYAEAGAAAIALLARRTEKLDKVAEELRLQFPGIVVVTARCDVSEVSQIAPAFDAAEKLSGGRCFDVVVNNAGVGPVNKFQDESEASYNGTMDVNLKGAFFVAQEAAKRMIKGKTQGSIINISSIYGLRVGYGHSVYSMSKAALTQMTKAIALEVCNHGIRCNSVNPGFFRTELTQDYYDSPKGNAFLEKHVPLKRLGLLEELDGVMLLLSSDASRFMHGAVITVDGAHAISSL